MAPDVVSLCASATAATARESWGDDPNIRKPCTETMWMLAAPYSSRNVRCIQGRTVFDCSPSVCMRTMGARE